MNNIEQKTREALFALCRGDGGLSDEAAAAKADRNLAAAVARIEPVFASAANTPKALVNQWRQACMDLRPWIRQQP